MSATVLTTSSLKLSTSSCSLYRQPLSSALSLKFARKGSTLLFARNIVRCNSTSPADENGSKSVLDAFFLGKALAEVVNERVESSLGEFRSSIGRIQANQQKHVEKFQEEVVERAKRAREQASQEAVARQGHLSKASPVETPTSPLGDSTTPYNNKPSSSDGIDPIVAMMTED